MTEWSKSSCKESRRWRSAEILLFSIDWKISGLMIKVYNTRSYSALPGQTAKVIWLERYDWKSVAMEILLKLSRSFSALALYKEKARWLKRSKKSDEGREFKWEMKEMGYVRVFIWAHKLTFSNLTWYEKRATQSWEKNGKWYIVWRNN